MSEISVSILGLGKLGMSMALALQRYNRSGGKYHLKLTGYDSRQTLAKTANKKGIFDRVEFEASTAVRGQDIVVIAMPYAEVEATYQRISDDLRDDVVILDTSLLTQPSQKWSKKYLSEKTHLVTIAPVLNPKYLYEGLDDPELAREDAFDKGTMLIMPSARCPAEAVDLATNFAVLLGSKPHFLDPVEFDGLIAATEGLPALIGVAYFYTLLKSEAWGDLQRVTNPAFGMLTRHLFDTHPDDLRDQWLQNKDNLVRYTDAFIAMLRQFRNSIAEGNLDAIEAATIDAAQEYEAWINRRHNDEWDDDNPPALDGGSTLLSGLLGGKLADRLLGRNTDD